MRLITDEKLASVLRVHKQSILNWRNKSFPGGHVINVNIHFSFDEVNNFLKLQANYTDGVPTLEDLLTGRDRLLTFQEAAQLLECREQMVSYNTIHGKLRTIRLNRRCNRIAMSEIERQRRLKQSLSEAFTIQVTAHVLGSEKRVYAYLRQGKLKKQKNRINPQSLYSLLFELLPPYVHPIDWVSDRLDSPYPLVRFRTAQTRLRIDISTLKKMIKEERIAYISHPVEGQRHLLFLSEEAIVLLDKFAYGLTAEDLCFIFGIGRRRAKAIIAGKQRLCYTSGHRVGCLKKQCVVAALEKVAYSGVNAEAWYRAQLDATRLPLIPAIAYGKQVGLRATEVFKAVNNGTLAAINRMGRPVRLVRQDQEAYR